MAKPTWGKRPSVPAAPTVEDFVSGGAEKRVTLAVSAEMHRRLKAAVALEGTSIKDLVTEYLTQWLASKGNKA